MSQMKMLSTPTGSKPLFDAYKKATKISWWAKLLMLFKRREYVTTADGIRRFGWTYKMLFGKRYVLSVSELPPEHFNCRCQM